jgi:hypothetical protein
MATLNHREMLILMFSARKSSPIRLGAGSRRLEFASFSVKKQAA